MIASPATVNSAMTARAAAVLRNAIHDPRWVSDRIAGLAKGFYCVLPITPTVEAVAAKYAQWPDYRVVREGDSLRITHIDLKARPVVRGEVVATLCDDGSPCMLPEIRLGPGGDFTRDIRL